MSAQVIAKRLTNADTDSAEPGDRYTGGNMRFAPIAVTGTIAAMDLRTNKRLWSQRWPGRCYSGLVATGNLLFADAMTGGLPPWIRDRQKLWSS